MGPQRAAQALCIVLSLTPLDVVHGRERSLSTSEDVASCLASPDGGASCNARRPCGGVSFDDGGADGDATAAAAAADSCLLARVPWLTPHAQVHCCFRCCLEFWTVRLGLMAHFEHWQNTTSKGRIDLCKTHGMPRIDEARVRGVTSLSTVVRSALEKVLTHVSRRPKVVRSCAASFFIWDSYCVARIWRLVRRARDGAVWVVTSALAQL